MELRLIPGAGEACRRLREANFRLIVVTNQPDVARGRQTRERVEEINDAVQRALSIDLMVTCYHDDGDRCGCRKPKPGMLLTAAARFEINVPASFMVGDRWRDVEAGRAAGCRSILIERAYSGRERCRPDRVVRDLGEAAQLILAGGLR